MSTDRKAPEGVDAEVPIGWDGTLDEAQQRTAEDTDAELLLTDAALKADDPVSGEAVRRGADPDLAVDADRGEEP